MDNNELKNIQKPEWKWYFFFPFTRGARDYKKDRELYEYQFLTRIQRIRRQEETAINGVSVLLITLITTLWSVLPPLTTLPNWLGWMKMGMDGFGSNNWGNQIMLTLIPTTAGTFIHKFPYLLPNRGLKNATNLAIKVIPVLILTICWYLVHQELKIKQIKALDKLQKPIINPRKEE